MTVVEVARLVGRKLLVVLPVLFAVSVLTFAVMSLIPGDPTTAILGERATPETRAALAAQLGLDRPPLQRYLTWVGGALTGDLGISYRTRQPVVESIVERLPVTVELLLLSQILAILIAVPVAVWSAYRAGRAFDQAATLGSFTIIAVPPFVLAMLLGYVFAYLLGWFPTSGYTPLLDNPVKNLQSVFLPAASLAAGSAAVYHRMLRAEMLRTLEQDFILVARAKGLSTVRILLAHALRPSSFPLVTMVGLTMGSLIGGALVVEIIFGLPGLGRLLYDAILGRDYIVVQGVVAFIAVAYVVLNFLVDISYNVLDPRVRRG